MTRSLGETLSLLADKGKSNISDHFYRGIEKESLRISSSGSISNSDHPSSLGSALTNAYITTDFSEALLELITPKKDSIESALQCLQEICKFLENSTDDRVWPSSIPCSIENEASIRLADYGSSNSGRLKTLYRSGLSYRYGSMMQTVSGIHYNFSFDDDFFNALREEESLKEFKNNAYLNLIRNFRRNAWVILYLFGSSPVVPKTFITNRENFLDELNSEDLFLENATCLRMSELGYMSKAQDNLFIAYNDIEEYLSDLKNALVTEHSRYAEVGLERNGIPIQINTSIIQIENEYYSSIRPKRVTPSGERPINILREKGIDYVEIRALDNNSFLPGGIDEETSYFLEGYLLYSFFGEDKKSDRKEIEELLSNWQAVVRNGRNENQMLFKSGKDVSIKSAGLQLIDEIATFINELPKEMGIFKEKVMASLDKQKLKFEDSDLTPSGRIVKQLKEKDQSWQELNYDLIKSHKEFYEKQNLNTEYLTKEAISSLQEFKKLQDVKEMPFEKFLEEYLKEI